jgi:hypothetical protein
MGEGVLVRTSKKLEGGNTYGLARVKDRLVLMRCSLPSPEITHAHGGSFFILLGKEWRDVLAGHTI